MAVPPTLDTVELFNVFFRAQQDEVMSQRKTWASVINDEETWILSNCPDLYTIRKSTEQLEHTMEKPEIYRAIIKGILTVHNAKATPPNQIPETGNNARRIVACPGDFKHTGELPTAPRWGLIEDGYTVHINRLKQTISEALVDDPLNNNIANSKQFVSLLTLKFTPIQKTHHGLIAGELNTATRTITVTIIDPCNLYVNTFGFLFQEAFNSLQRGYYVYNPTTGSYNTTDTAIPGASPFHGYTLVWEAPIVTTYLRTITRPIFPATPTPTIPIPPTVEGTTPVTDTEKYAVQNYWGQDKFCVMWCVMFAHRFLITGTIASLRTLYTEIVNNPNINLVIIKAYIIEIFKELGVNTSRFFNFSFDRIWSCYEIKNGPVNGPLPPADQINYVPPSPLPQFYTFQISCTPVDFLFNATVTSIGISPLVPAALPPINRLNRMPASNSLTDKQAILATGVITPAVIAHFNILPTDSIFKIIHYYLNNYGEYMNPDTIYNTYTRNGLIDMPPCPSAAAGQTARDVNLYPKMKNVPGDDCTKLSTVINTRNNNYAYQNNNMICDIHAIPRPLYPHQLKTVIVMQSKTTPLTVPSPPPGLLVWFGTGTGKTITANSVAKVTTVCNQNYRKCFIVSTKSVYKTFAASLGDDTKMTPDALLPNPTNPKQGQDAAYFVRHSYIPGIATAVQNIPETDIYVFSAPRFIGMMMDTATGTVKANMIPELNQSLLIIDEAHKMINIEGDETASQYHFFQSCCMAAKQVMLLTATPMVNSPYDMEMLMALIDRRPVEPVKRFNENYVGKVTVTGSDESDICPVLGISPVNFNLPVSYSTNPLLSGPAKFGNNRIIHYDPTAPGVPAPTPNPMPLYQERKLCVSTTTPGLLERELLRRPAMEVLNIETSIPKAFGSNELNNPAYISTKIETIFKMIGARESTSANQLIDYATFTGIPIPVSPMVPPPAINFKYVIYSRSTNFLLALSTFLESRLNIVGLNLIGKLTGEVQDRKSVIRKYNNGSIRILLITDAAMEGVDLRRTAMIILAEPVWTKSKYDQIKGRGVRNLSGQRLKDADYDIVLNRLNSLSDQINTEYTRDRPLLQQAVIDTTAIQTARLASIHSPRQRAIQAPKSQKIIDTVVDKLNALDYRYTVMTQNGVDAMATLAQFRSGVIGPAQHLVNTINPLDPSLTPYSLILKEELDFCAIPDVIDCMTLILSYSANVGGIPKYSIDTYMYNAMRVKNSQINFFTNQMISSSFIPIP